MDEALIKRVPPHSIEAEQSVVGAMLMDKETIDAKDVESCFPEDIQARARAKWVNKDDKIEDLSVQSAGSAPVAGTVAVA